MRAASSTKIRKEREANLPHDRLTEDALAVASAESNQPAGFPGVQSAFGVGALIATTCFAGFLTLGLELPGAMVNWAQLRH